MDSNAQCLCKYLFQGIRVWTEVWHLPCVSRLNHESLQLPTLKKPWKELRVESRREALGAPGKGAGEVFYFQEKTWWAQFSPLLIRRRAPHSFAVTSAPWTSSDLLKNMCLAAGNCPLHQNHIETDFPPTSLKQFFKGDLKCCLPGHGPHFAPNKI